MAITTECPSCNGKLRVPDDLLGKQVKCPTCGATFKAATADAAASSPPDDPALLEEESPWEVTDEPPRKKKDSTSRRRVDAEDDDDDDDRPRRRASGGQNKYLEPHRGALILTLGIVSIVIPFVGLICGITAWMLGHRDLKKMQANLMDPQGKGLTQAGWICGIIGTVLDSCRWLCCLGYLGFYAFILALFVGSVPPVQKPPLPASGHSQAPPVGPWFLRDAPSEQGR